MTSTAMMEKGEDLQQESLRFPDNDEKGEPIYSKDGETSLYPAREADGITWTEEDEKKLKVGQRNFVLTQQSLMRSNIYNSSGRSICTWCPFWSLLLR